LVISPERYNRKDYYIRRGNFDIVYVTSTKKLELKENENRIFPLVVHLRECLKTKAMKNPTRECAQFQRPLNR
jgi:hypothetical protein